MMKRSVFWGSLGLVAYTYIGFPILVLVRGLLMRNPPKKESITPSVSQVVVAYNEAATIGAKLENILKLDYPVDKLEIIIASDGSYDGTNEIVTSYTDRGVIFLPFPRLGKIRVMNEVVSRTTGEILVFSDANSIFCPDALRILVQSFADSKVGAVGGNQRYLSNNEGGSSSMGERIYWNFDRNLKILQSNAGNMIAATGAIYAIRRELFRPVPVGVLDDHVISTQAVAQGYRLVFESDAIAFETIAPTDEAEFRRKVRVIVQGLQTLWIQRPLFNPLRYGFYSVQLFSHKLLRWSIVWPLIILLAVSPSLYRASRFYRIVTLVQLGFYMSAFVMFVLRRTPIGRLKFLKVLGIPYYFCMVNVAALRAWVHLLSGKRVVMWESTQRQVERQ